MLFFCYLTPFWVILFLDMKAVKEFYERRQEEKIRGQDIIYILPLFLGSITIRRVRKFFLNKNEDVKMKMLKCVSRSWVNMSKFGI